MTEDVKRDRWGRYVLPHPVTGEEQGWTRATTLASTLSDDYNITAWKMRLVAQGIAANKNLRARIAATSEKAELNKVAQDALAAAGGNERSEIGTALHSMTEMLDDPASEMILSDFDEEWQGDLLAYGAGVETSGLTFTQIERIVVCPDIEVAGTLDRIALLDGVAFIADLKTGSTLTYSLMDIAIQLSIYANATNMWDLEAEQYEDMPPVDREKGLVMHLPAGAGTFDLWEVDIKRGWELAQLCVQVRAARKENKKIGRLVK